MKKQLLIVLGILISGLSFSQCTINGKSIIKVQDEEMYSLSPEIGQCKDCHLWSNYGKNATIISDNKLSSIRIKANEAGRQLISISALTSQGMVQCSKTIEILDGKNYDDAINGTSADIKQNTNTSKNCDIEVTDFKQGKFGDGIVNFFPNVSNNEYKYSWTVTYSDGSIMKSADKTPQFPYTKEKGISVVKLQIFSKNCIKDLSRSYEPIFWEHF